MILPALAFAAALQGLPSGDPARLGRDLQLDYIAANVPAHKDFERFLERDIIAYFISRGVKQPSIKIDLLRPNATQSGLSNPKYYLWVLVSSSGVQKSSGALRVEAIEKARFNVTDFIPREEVSSEPDRLSAVFPAALIREIMERSGAVDHR